MELELDSVTKHFGGITALKDVSLAMEKGHITALIGPNGAGKTTVFDIISGFLKPDNGRVLFRGKRIDGVSPHVLARKGIGRLFQDVKIFEKMTVMDNVLVASRFQAGENPFVSVCRPRFVNRIEKANRAEAQSLLERVGLAGKGDLWAEHLSYGQQKLLAIARLLAGNADVLLLDEPTAGVSPHMIDEILEVIREVARDGKTVVVIEHNLNVILNLCHWVFLLDDGEVSAFGTAREVLEDRALQEAYLGV